MFKKACSLLTIMILFYLLCLYYITKNNILKYILAVFSIFAIIYHFHIIIHYYCYTDNILPSVNNNVSNDISNLSNNVSNNISNQNITIEPETIMIKVNNISELNHNFNDNCCICLEYIDPIDSYKLDDCDYHLYHKECIKLYIQNKYKISYL